MLDLVNNPNPTPEQLQAELDALPAQTIRPADDPIEAPDGAEPGTVYFDVPDAVPEMLTPEELMKEVNAIQAVVTAQPIPFDDAPAEGKARVIYDLAMQKAAEAEANGDTTSAAKYRKTAAAAGKMLDYLTKHADDIARSVEQLGEALKARQDYLHRLEPFLRKELKRMHQEHPETEGVTLNTLLYSVGTETVDEQELADLAAEFADETEPGLKYIRFIVDAIRRAQAALIAKRKEKKPQKQRQLHIGAMPEQILYPLDAVNYYAMNGSFQSGEFEAVAMFPRQYRLQNGKYTKGKPVDVFVMLEYEGTDIAQQLDQIDGAILCGIYSLLDAGETRFLASHIWEFIAGEGQKTNKTRIEDITKRVLRMTRTTAKIDFGQFAEAKGLDYTDILNVQILPGISVKERKNKRGEFIEGEIYCTQPLELFPLYRFAEITGQITRVPIRAATVRGLTMNDKPQQLTDNRIKIRETLLYRIVRKHHNKSDQVILFTTIYDKVNANSKIERQRVRDAAESFLIEWAELGTIYNYAFRKKGKSFDAIVIANTPEEMQNHPGLTWLAR